MKDQQLHRYLIFSIASNILDIEYKGPRDATYEQFVDDLQKSRDCRIALYDFYFREKQNLIWILWTPDDAAGSMKSFYNNAFNKFKKTLPTVQGQIRAGRLDEITTDVFEDILTPHYEWKLSGFALSLALYAICAFVE